MVTPYFRVQKSAGGFALDGPPSCCLRNKLPGGPGERPAGVFLRWNWNGRQLLVENSQEGFCPLFYFADDTQVCVSPSIVLLLAQGAPADAITTSASRRSE